MVAQFLCVVAVFSLNQASDAPSEQIMRISGKAAAAYKAKDTSTYLSFFTPDYIHRKLNGEVLSRPSFDYLVKQQLKFINVLRTRSNFRRVSVEGRSSVAIVHSTVEAIAGIEQATLLRLSRQTWRLSIEGWKLAKSEVLAEKIDSKFPVDAEEVLKVSKTIRVEPKLVHPWSSDARLIPLWFQPGFLDLRRFQPIQTRSLRRDSNDQEVPDKGGGAYQQWQIDRY